MRRGPVRVCRPIRCRAAQTDGARRASASSRTEKNRAPRARRWRFPSPQSAPGEFAPEANRCATPGSRSPLLAGERQRGPQRRSGRPSGGSLKDLLVEHDFGALPRFLKPIIQLYVGSLSGERLTDAVAVVLHGGGLGRTGGFCRGPDVLFEVLLNITVAHLNPRAEPDLDESEERQLPQQRVFDLLLGDSVLSQGPLELGPLRVALFAEFVPFRFDGRGIRRRKPAELQFTPDQFLFHHAIGGGPDFTIQVAGRDHSIADRNGDAIDHLCAGQSHARAYEEQWQFPSQNVCPIEKKNWKWLTLCSTHLVGALAHGFTPALIKSCWLPLNPKKLGGLIL